MGTRLIVGSERMKSRLLGLLLLTALSGVAVAETPEQVVNADTPQKLAEVQAAVDQQMGAGGRYEFISADRRGQVEGLFHEMHGMLERSGSVSAMPERDRLQLFNLQEKLNGLLAGGDSERLVCEKKAPIGALVPVKTCRTYGEIERQRRQKDRYFDNARKRNSTVRAES